MALPGDLPSSRFTGAVYRVVMEGRDPLSTEGSNIAGGRYNSPGESGTLYCSLESGVARAEVSKHAHFSLKSRWWRFSLETELSSVLDLTNPSVLIRFGISPDELIRENLATTRRIGAEARKAGFEAIIAPSAAVGDAKNLVIFLENAKLRPREVRSEPVTLETQT